MSIFQEAVNAFQFEHEFRCQDKKKCRHLKLIEEMYEREIIFDQKAQRINWVKIDVISKLEIARKNWIDTQHLKEGTLASWIDSVFDVAIKAVREIE